MRWNVKFQASTVGRRMLFEIANGVTPLGSSGRPFGPFGCESRMLLGLSGVGPWAAGQIATITIELMGQQMTFLNGGPAHALAPAFSYSIACKDQAEIDLYWDKLLEGGKPMACGWLTDKFGLCWQIVPEKIGEILKHPNAMATMMKMVKFDIAMLEAAAKE